MRAVIVPSTLALLPEYASIDDPIADLREAVTAAVDWLLEDGPAGFCRASPAGHRVALELLGDRIDAESENTLIVANGSATRTEKAPGHFDPRAEAFDAALGSALAAGDLVALRTSRDLRDLELTRELLAADADLFSTLGHRYSAITSVQVDYDDAPYGVQYWVVRWECS